jgi:uncharacterized membrane protein
MRPTRKIVAEFIGVFLIGGLAGGLVTWSYTDTQLSSFMNRSNSPEGLAARINEKYQSDYHLTPEEITRIQPDILAMARHIYLVRHQFGLDILSTLDDYHHRIAVQLTPDHRAAYEEAQAARKKKMTAMLLPDPDWQSNQGSN